MLKKKIEAQYEDVKTRYQHLRKQLHNTHLEDPIDTNGRERSVIIMVSIIWIKMRLLKNNQTVIVSEDSVCFQQPGSIYVKVLHL